MSQPSDKPYTDTLNRLFPWGCETESEVVTELVRRVKASEEKQANVWAENVFVANSLAQGVNALEKRIDQLERLLEEEDTND